MLKAILLTSLVCFTPFALAVERSDNGKGQVLLFPFFTTENGWDSYINTILSVSDRKYLKVRVLNGVDGAVVNSFNVYIKQAENWRAALAQIEPNNPILRVSEGYCTISSDGSFGGPGTDFPLNTSTGLIEVYQVGVRDDRLTNVLMNASCEELAQRWEEGGAWDENPMADLNVTELHADIIGQFEIINVARGLSSEQPAIGLRDFMPSIPHTAPGSNSPNLADAEPIARLDTGEIVQPESGEGIDAVALLLSTRKGTITNDVVLSTEVAASTDWIVSFPLRGYKDYGSHQVEIDGVMRTCNENEPTGDAAVYIDTQLHNHWTSWGGGRYWSGTLLEIDPVPPQRYTPFLCYAVNVLTFGDTAPILLSPGSILQENVGLVPDGDLQFPSDSFTVTYTFSDGSSLPEKNDGRPVVAYRVTSFVNGTLEGGNVLSNYLFMRPHVVE
jgi:hypothetical protein